MAWCTVRQVSIWIYEKTNQHKTDNSHVHPNPKFDHQISVLAIKVNYWLQMCVCACMRARAHTHLAQDIYTLSINTEHCTCQKWQEKIKFTDRSKTKYTWSFDQRSKKNEIMHCINGTEWCKANVCVCACMRVCGCEAIWTSK